MGDIQHHAPALLFLAVFSRYEAALAWARQRAVEAWGPMAVESEPLSFHETRYYEKTMGADLRKVLIGFAQLVDPARLPELKLTTNQWEQEYARLAECPESRPLNLDPGYVTEAKLVLASTKDRDHRIYLAQGIFAENTLYYGNGAWQNRPWTYPNYQRADYHQFLDRCREYYRCAKRGSDRPAE